MHKLTYVTAALLFALAGCAAPPSEIDDVAAHFRTPRDLAFMLSSPKAKASTLREHFTRYAARPGLTEAQRAACLGMAASVTEVAFWSRETPEWQAWVMGGQDEDAAVRAAFGDDLEAANEVLHTLD